MIGEPGDARQSAGKVVRTLASVWKVTRDPDLDPGVPPAPFDREVFLRARMRADSIGNLQGG